MNRREALQLVLGYSLFSAIAIRARFNNGTDLLQRFQDKYRGVNSVSCSFSTEMGLAGSLIARRGGLYRITLTDRVIVCDGVSVWSATTSARTVIINSYTPTSDEVSLERIFFEIMSIYTGTIIESRSKGGTIRLLPPDKSTVIAGITAVDVTLDGKTLVTSVAVTQNGSTQTFVLRNLKLEGKTSKSSFTFSTPKGWEVIDLR